MKNVQSSTAGNIREAVKTKDNPGVYIPPPLFYVAIFFISIFIQRQYPISFIFLTKDITFILGLIFIVFGITILLPAVIKFFRTKNTLVTIKPANSLQTSGIYSISRNPMYLGLLLLYIGIAFLQGNAWTFIFIPVVIMVITYFVILKEEKYLSRAFDNLYSDYRKKVRRWI